MALGLVFMGAALGIAGLVGAALTGICAQEFSDAEKRNDVQNANISARDGLKYGAVTAAIWVLSVLCLLGANP